jgi:hypothetical protein
METDGALPVAGATGGFLQSLEVFFFSSPATAPEEELDAWLMTSPLGTPRGRYDEYRSKIFPQ